MMKKSKVKAILKILLGFIMPITAIIEPEKDIKYKCTVKGVKCLYDGTIESWENIIKDFKECFL